MDISLLWSAIGVIVGSIVTNIIWFLRSRSGCLKIDRSNPEKDVYRIAVHGDLSTLHKKKILILTIDKNADLSQD